MGEMACCQIRIFVKCMVALTEVRNKLKRVKKALKCWPRPSHKLRPIVQCRPSAHNHKCRIGRGFTLAEVREAWKQVGKDKWGGGCGKLRAMQLGIAMDPRRKNRSQEGLDRNVERLKEYFTRLVICEDLGRRKPEKGK